MKLKRGNPIRFASHGYWTSADEHWQLLGDAAGWTVSVTGGFIGEPETDARIKLLQVTGIGETIFPTRRALIAALELAIEGASL